MVIKGQRVKKREMERTLTAHILNGDENDAIRILKGGGEHIAACIAAAEIRGCKYVIRHFILALERPIGDKGAFWLVDQLGGEFGFDAGNVTLVEHVKPRRRIAAVPHYHLLVPEYDPDNGGGVLDSRHTYARHEKVARLAEAHFGHVMTPGAHNDAVARALDGENPGLAEEVRKRRPARRRNEPATSYTASEAAAAKRMGDHPGDLAEAVREAWTLSEDASAFHERLAAIGLRAAPGTKRPGVVCLWRGSRCGQPLYRIIKGIGNTELRAFLAGGGGEIAEIPMLSAEEVAAVFNAELEAMRPVVDTSPLDKALETRASAKRSREAMREGAEKWEAERVATEAQAVRIGRFRRLISPRARKEFARLRALVDSHARNAADYRRCEAQPALEDRQFMDGVRAAQADVAAARRKADAVFERKAKVLEGCRRMALEGRLPFASVEEVVEFIEQFRIENDLAASGLDRDTLVLRPETSSGLAYAAR